MLLPATENALSYFELLAPYKSPVKRFLHHSLAVDRNFLLDRNLMSPHYAKI